MVNVSSDFAPPFKLIAPYFIIGTIFYIFTVLLAFGFDISNANIQDSFILGWAHLFLLGFIIMIIFGAMAQLIPVILEVGHFSVEFYYIIYPLLFIGAILMALGFGYQVWMLPVGGTIVLIAMSIFLFETFLTILKVKKLTLIMKSVAIANLFLLFGIIVGIVMALGFSGAIEVNIYSLLKAHIFLVLFGYVGITIIALSMILIPMFGLSHNFSQTPFKVALTLISFGVILVVISSLIDIDLLKNIGYYFSILAIFIYIYQVYIIYKSRARKEHDIYAKSLVVAYFSLLISILMIFYYISFDIKEALHAGSWLALIGFLGFLIIGHLYKIVPFLVWFERFSPLVGKQKIPMLADMLPKKGVNFQFYFSFSGIIISTFGVLISYDEIFKIGISFLSVGSILLLSNLIYIIKYK